MTGGGIAGGQVSHFVGEVKVGWVEEEEEEEEVEEEEEYLG